MDTEKILAIAVILVAVVAGCILLSHFSRRRKRCPNCHRARVPNQSLCPFCGANYDPNAAITRFDGQASPLPGNAPMLVCVGGPYEGQSFPISSSEFLIGRGESSKLTLEGSLISRQHAEIRLKDGHYHLYDHESTNGTYVNQQRVAHHILKAGDHFQIGPYVLLFRPAGHTIAPSTPPLLRPVEQHKPAPTGGFDAYECLEMIGGGGMATVYRARSRQDHSVVAIKVFHQTDPYLMDKFAQEIRIGMSLQGHPHIAKVFGGGNAGSLYYMVMEYVDNLSLRERLRLGQPLPFDAIVTVIGQTCDALSHAHSRGIIHRDIKPENIMFSSNAGVKLVDFGIAKLTSARTVTMDGMLVGTSYYMSYEAAQGLTVDQRSDLYSLGIVLYEMLTGQVPFKGGALTVVNKHIHEQPTLPSKITSSVPQQAEEVVMRALAKDAGRRFQSAEEMARALGYSAPFSTPTPTPLAKSQPTTTTHRPAAGSSLGGVRLVNLQSSQIITVNEATIVIGRGDIQPFDSKISREHARIGRRGNEYWLEDLQSTNGTFLNEVRTFEPVILRPGDLIRIGRTRLRVERPAS